MTSVAYGIAMPTSRGILTQANYCAEAQAFFARLATQPTAARKLLHDALIRSLVSAGVWAKLDALYIFAAADQATALTNLVQSSYGGTATNSPVFTPDQGFAGGSSKSISSGFNPSTAGGLFAQNSASAFAWSLASAANGGSTVGMSAGNNIEITPRWSDSNYYGGINCGELLIAASVTDGSGLRTHSRTASVGFSAYTNATFTTAKTFTSSALANGTILFLQSSLGNYTGTAACGGFGSGLTAQNVTDLYNALHVYLQAVAGVA